MRKKLKFDAEEYIDFNYVENEDAIISIYVEEVDDFYNEFDADELTLSDDIVNFINNRVETISNKYGIVLEFDVPKMSSKEKEKIINIIRSNYGLTSSLKNKALQTIKYKSLVFFLIGIPFLLFSYSMSDFGELGKEVLSIVGWVSIWEAISAMLFDNFKLRTSKLKVDRLFNAPIKFSEREE